MSKFQCGIKGSHDQRTTADCCTVCWREQMKRVPLQMKGRDGRMSRLFLLSQSAPIFGSPILHNSSYFGYLYESLLEGAMIVEGIVSFYFFSVTRTKSFFSLTRKWLTHRLSRLSFRSKEHAIWREVSGYSPSSDNTKLWLVQRSTDAD